MAALGLQTLGSPLQPSLVVGAPVGQCSWPPLSPHDKHPPWFKGLAMVPSLPTLLAVGPVIPILHHAPDPSHGGPSFRLYCQGSKTLHSDHPPQANPHRALASIPVICPSLSQRLSARPRLRYLFWRHVDNLQECSLASLLDPLGQGNRWQASEVLYPLVSCHAPS